MRGKHCGIAFLSALAIFPAITLAAEPRLSNMADSLDAYASFLPLLMLAAFLLWGISHLFQSGGSEQSVEQAVSADMPASIPSSVEGLQQTAGGADQLAITKTEPLLPTQPDQPGRVGRKLHLD